MCASEVICLSVDCCLSCFNSTTHTQKVCWSCTLVQNRHHHIKGSCVLAMVQLKNLLLGAKNNQLTVYYVMQSNVCHYKTKLLSMIHHDTNVCQENTTMISMIMSRRYKCMSIKYYHVINDYVTKVQMYVNKILPCYQ